jgi:DNA-binding PadR family transcriptional regulator
MSEATRLTVLGMVRRRPHSYGYAIVDEVSRWSAPEGVAPSVRGVYKALEALRDGELIAPASAVDGTSVQRRRYVATPKGEERYLDWLHSPTESFADLFRRLGSAKHSDLPVLIELVRTAEHELVTLNQDLQPSEPASLVDAGASWADVSAAILQTAEWNESAARAGFQRSIRRELEYVHARYDATAGAT